MQIRKSLAFVLAGALLGVTAACQPPADQEGMEAAAVDTAAILDAFDEVRADYEEAFDAGDFAGVASHYTGDAVASFPGAPPVTGRAGIQSAMEETTPEGATVTIEPSETRVLSNDVAYDFGTSTQSFTPEGADEPVESTSSYLVILNRTANGWKISRAVVSPNEPPSDGEM
jgi:uncharacterized protein (TIGR02246 family)